MNGKTKRKTKSREAILSDIRKARNFTNSRGGKGKTRSVRNTRRPSRGNNKSLTRSVQKRTSTAARKRSNVSPLGAFHSRLRSRFAGQKIKNGSGDPVPIVHQWQDEAELDIRIGQQEKASFDSVSIEGTDYLGKVVVYPTSATLNEPTNEGSVVYRHPLGPVNFPGTRLKELGELYQRYECLEIYVHLVPTTNAFQAGSIIPVILYDPDLSLTEFGSDEMRVRMALSMYDATMVNVYQPVTVAAPGHFNQTLWTKIEDTDARLTIPGSIAIIAASSFIPFSGTPEELTLYNMFISYRFKFSVRGLTIPGPLLADASWNSNGDPLNSVFWFDGAGTVAEDLPVCLQLQQFAPEYRSFNYIFECIATAPPGPLKAWWQGPNQYVTFKTDGAEQGFAMYNGSPLYMFLSPANSVGAQCFHFATNLTAALERRPNLLWASGGLSTAVLFYGGLKINPVPVA